MFTSGGELESLIVKDVSRRPDPLLALIMLIGQEAVIMLIGQEAVIMLIRQEAGHLQSGSGPDRSP